MFVCLSLFYTNTKKMDLSKYAAQIEGIAAHAKSIGFNPESGNYDDLYRSWIQMSSKFWQNVEDNKSDALVVVKNLINNPN